MNEKKQKENKKRKSANALTSPQLFKASLIYQTKEFFNNSTLHGVRYIAESGRPFGEKFMWFCFTSIGAVAALIIIFSLWEKFQTNPTITGLDTDFHNQQVIFPTVSICPTKPYDSAKVKDFAYKSLGGYEEGSEKFEPFLQLLTQLTYDKMKDLYEMSLNFTSDWNSVRSKTLRRYVFSVAADCTEIFKLCKYKDDEIDCCTQFLPIYTENGFCYAFNSRYRDTADAEQKNPKINDMFETDKKWALSVMLKTTAEVYIHSHEESPGWDFRSQFSTDVNDAVDVLISMKQTYTTDDARQLSVNQRKCIFPNERKLKYYNDEYTFTGCMRECRIKKAIRFCQCAPPFYRPSTYYSYCNVDNLKCLADFTKNITDIKGCTDCELSCQNTVYDIEKLSKTSLDTSLEKFDPLITVEYLTWPIVRYKREVLFGWVDLLVSFGGIAGLFLGFSLLSGVEIIYYFTMRACCMLYKNRDELYKIEYEKMQRPQERLNLSLKPTKKRKTRSSSLPPILNVQETINNNNYNKEKDIAINNNNVKIISRMSTEGMTTIGKRNFMKPNFKLGKIAPYDIYTNKMFKSNSDDMPFVYMP